MNKVKFLILISAALSLLLSACTDYAQKIEDEYGPKEEKDDSGKDFSYEIFKDERDGRTYKAVYIGDKLWMAENLNYDTGICYGFEDRLCDKYGRLYSWNEARKACPDGWHLPTKEEIESLVSSVGGLTIAGIVLRSSTDWESDIIVNDDNHFSALPAGMLGFDGTFAGVGYTTAFWSSTQSTDTLSYYLIMRSENPDARINEGSQNYGYSVRCVEGYVNEIPSSSSINEDIESSSSGPVYEEFYDDRDGKTYRKVKIGTQTWMADNLDYEKEGSLCYADDEANCVKYGRLYTWELAQSVCPDGWHLPSPSEFQLMLDVVERDFGSTSALFSSEWDYDLNGLNASGFSALPAGRRDNASVYQSMYDKALFWSNSRVPSKPSAYNLYLSRWNARILDDNDAIDANSVRCIEGELVDDEISQESFTDERDGRSYRTVAIGTQTWMAENLNYATDDSYCYDNNEEMCSEYGRLYTWYAAMEACPSGTHLPTMEEFETLISLAGGVDVAGGKLKSTSGWQGENGTDEFGFSALPAGYMSSLSGFSVEKRGCVFWSSTESDNDHSYNYSMGNDNNSVFLFSGGFKTLDGYSVRCILD